MKILFVYNSELDGSYGGSQRTVQNLNSLKIFADVDLFKFEKRSKLFTFLNAIIGYIGNSSVVQEKKLINTIKKTNYDYIYFDQAIHGNIVKKINNKFGINCFVHYHNNEEEYYRDLYKTSGSLFYIFYKMAKRNQNYSLRYAWKNIFITKEDSISVGISNNQKIVIPITLNNKYEIQQYENNKEKYLLYVGAATYANIEGAKYIIKEIAPNVRKQFILVGKNLKTEIEKQKINIPKNISIFDFVDDLSQYFINANAFISPLFYGSGMKVKLAEAMMYGKKIIGTSLSFWGYQRTDNCVVCNDKISFINAVNEIDDNKTFFVENRQQYEKFYDSKLNETYYKQLFYRF